MEGRSVPINHHHPQWKTYRYCQNKKDFQDFPSQTHLRELSTIVYTDAQLVAAPSSVLLEQWFSTCMSCPLGSNNPPQDSFIRYLHYDS